MLTMVTVDGPASAELRSEVFWNHGKRTTMANSECVA